MNVGTEGGLRQRVWP